MTNHQRYQQRRQRKGLALVAVLVFTVVILMLVTSVTKALTRDHRQARLAEQRLQTLWLVESAVQRSIQALSQSADYAGETWEVPGSVLGDQDGAVVVIRVEAVANDPNRRLIQIEAKYPDHPRRLGQGIRNIPKTL